MALVSKSEAARLAGVSRTTIHRYTTDGKLSEQGGQIDTSELIRVFGEIREQGGTPVKPVNSGQRVTGGEQALIDALTGQIADLKQDRDHWRQKVDDMAALLRAEQESTRLLTHQAQPDPTLPARVLTAVVMAGILTALVYLLVTNG